MENVKNAHWFSKLKRKQINMGSETSMCSQIGAKTVFSRKREKPKLKFSILKIKEYRID